MLKRVIYYYFADQNSIVHDALGHLREEVAKRQNMIDESLWNFVWITEFYV